jgi:hypothetical protein
MQHVIAARMPDLVIHISVCFQHETMQALGSKCPFCYADAEHPLRIAFRTGIEV